MLKSMTAYGRSTVDTPLGRFTVEVQSINRRHLEAVFHLPHALMRFENDFRQKVSAVMGRGKVSVKIGIAEGDSGLVNMKANLPLILEMKQAASQIAEILGVTEKEAVLALLKKEPDAVIHEEEDRDLDGIKQILDGLLQQALSECDLMRTVEGAALQKDISGRLDALESLCEKIAAKGPQIKENYFQKIKERLAEVFPEAEDEQVRERALREACLFADKADIEEELTRFRSHLSQFRAILDSESSVNGKKLEFLLQEMLRETNTIAAKSTDAELSGWSVEMKTEIERVREQVQNVE